MTELAIQQLATLAQAIEQHPALGALLVSFAEGHRLQASMDAMPADAGTVRCDPAADPQRLETAQREWLGHVPSESGSDDALVASLRAFVRAEATKIVEQSLSVTPAAVRAEMVRLNRRGKV